MIGTVRKLAVGGVAAVVLAFAGAANDAEATIVADFVGLQQLHFGANGAGSVVFGDEDGGFDDLFFNAPLDLVGLLGDLDGDFDIADPAGGSTTTVTSTGGSLTINDAGDVFTAAVDFITLSQQSGTQSFTFEGTIGLSTATYTGTNASLIALRDQTNNGTASITTQIQGAAPNLQGLFDADINSGSQQSASYSGSIATVPEPATLALLGIGLVGAGIVARRRANV